MERGVWTANAPLVRIDWAAADATAIWDALVAQAVAERASDIHVEPLEDALRVRMRIDGALREIVSLPQTLQPSVCARIKILSNLDIAEKRRPQDGHVRYSTGGRTVDLRVSTLPTVAGEKIAVRVLDRRVALLPIQELGFSEENLSLYERLCRSPHGMLLATGPTGSGKSTTLYATLARLHTAEKNIVTIEDPVEYRIDGINQAQVNPKADLTFAKLLRSVLRQDPNVVMVGEIRDVETARIAVRAAMTGHVVLSSLHTNDAIGAVARLGDMGVESYLLASSLLGVVAQRLVRRICPHCRISYAAGDAGPERALLGARYAPDLVLWRGAGCEACAQTGYRGRIAVYEVLVVTEALRELIARGETAQALRAAALRGGMRTLAEDALDKVLAGLTTLREVAKLYGGLE